MSKKSVKKTITSAENREIICDACSKSKESIGVKGKTAIGNAGTLVPFIVCEDCYTKKLNAHVGSMNVTAHRKKWWDKLYANVRKRERNAKQVG